MTTEHPRETAHADQLTRAHPPRRNVPMNAHLTETEIKEITREFDLTEDTLDDLVHDACSTTASHKVNGDRGGLDFHDAYDQFHDDADQRTSKINNSGTAGQLRFLTAFYGGKEALRSLLQDQCR
ncbi:hypothetical protein ACWC1D_33350 [Streptomyces sp. NPDC001478]